MKRKRKGLVKILPWLAMTTSAVIVISSFNINPVIGQGEELIPETKSESAKEGKSESQIQISLPSYDEIRLKLNQLSDQDEKLQDIGKEYLLYLMSLKEKESELPFLKKMVKEEHIQMRGENNNYQIKDYDHSLNYDQYRILLTKIRQTQRTLQEKEIVIDKRKLEKKNLADQQVDLKREILSSQSQISNLQSQAQSGHDIQLNPSESISRELLIKKSIIRTYQDYKAALDKGISMLIELIDLANQDLKEYESYLNFLNRKLDLAHQNLEYSPQDMDNMDRHQRQVAVGLSSQSRKIEKLNQRYLQSFDILQDIKKEIQDIKLGGNQTDDSDANMNNDRMKLLLMSMRTNSQKANIQNISLRIQISDLNNQIEQAKLHYIQFSYLAALDRLSLSRINEKAANLNYHIASLKRQAVLGAKESELLAASVNTMTEMIDSYQNTLLIGQANQWQNLYYPKLISQLQTEIDLKNDSLLLLMKLSQLWAQCLNVYEDIESLLQRKGGVWRVLVQGSTQPGQKDILVGLSSLIFVGFWLLFGRRLFGDTVFSSWRKKMNIVIFLLPVVALALFFLGLSGYDSLYKFLYWSILKSLLIIFATLWLLSKLDIFSRRKIS